jgi:hypothetical protein
VLREDDVRAELATRERLLVTEAAFLYRRGRRTIYNWIDHGLPAVKARGRTWVKRVDVASWIATHNTHRARSRRNGTT